MTTYTARNIGLPIDYNGPFQTTLEAMKLHKKKNASRFERVMERVMYETKILPEMPVTLQIFDDRMLFLPLRGSSVPLSEIRFSEVMRAVPSYDKHKVLVLAIPGRDTKEVWILGLRFQSQPPVRELAARLPQASTHAREQFQDRSDTLEFASARSRNNTKREEIYFSSSTEELNRSSNQIETGSPTRFQTLEPSRSSPNNGVGKQDCFVSWVPQSNGAETNYPNIFHAQKGSSEDDHTKEMYVSVKPRDLERSNSDDKKRPTRRSVSVVSVSMGSPNYELKNGNDWKFYRKVPIQRKPSFPRTTPFQTSQMEQNKGLRYEELSSPKRSRSFKKRAYPDDLQSADHRFPISRSDSRGSTSSALKFLDSTIIFPRRKSVSSASSDGFPIPKVRSHDAGRWANDNTPFSMSRIIDGKRSPSRKRSSSHGKRRLSVESVTDSIAGHRNFHDNGGEQRTPQYIVQQKDYRTHNREKQSFIESPKYTPPAKAREAISPVRLKWVNGNMIKIPFKDFRVSSPDLESSSSTKGNKFSIVKVPKRGNLAVLQPSLDRCSNENKKGTSEGKRVEKKGRSRNRDERRVQGDHWCNGCACDSNSYCCCKASQDSDDAKSIENSDVLHVFYCHEKLEDGTGISKPEDAVAHVCHWCGMSLERYEQITDGVKGFEDVTKMKKKKILLR